MPLRSSLSAALLLFAAGGAVAAEIGPPMFDINRQCEAAHPHSATAMSECVVAESEARADVLQHWSSYSDAGAATCIKAGRKAPKRPYAAMAKCLSAEAPTAGARAAK